MPKEVLIGDMKRSEARKKLHTYRPYGGAASLFRCRAPEVLLEGPAGTGKSRCVGEYLLNCASQYPKCRIAVIRKTRVSLTESWMVTWETKVLSHGMDAYYLDQPLDNGPGRANRSVYNFKNGSALVLGGMDNPTRLFSTEYDIIYVNEANELREDEWESLHRALRNGVMPYQQLLGDCNPDHPLHWLNIRCNEGKTVRVLTRHHDNPSLTPEYLERLSRLTGVRRKRLYEGVWAAAEGQVWMNFDAALHIIDGLPSGIHRDAQGRPQWAMVVASIDWGYTKAGCIHVYGVDEDGRMYLLREVYRSQINVVASNPGEASWLEWAKNLDLIYRPVAWICDPAEPGFIDSFRRAGLAAVEADNDVIPGIDAVRDRLQKQQDHRPRLYFMRHALRERCPILSDDHLPCGIVEEIPGYVFRKGDDGKPVDEEPDRGCEDHACDTCRYAVRYVDRYFSKKKAISEYKPGTWGRELDHEEAMQPFHLKL